jgi:hypothetical protein
MKPKVFVQLLETPYQLEPPINRLIRAEVQEVINSLNPKKSSGCDSSPVKFLKNCLLKYNILPGYSMLSCSKGTMEFDFGQNHPTLQRTHRILGRMNAETKQYCSAAFLDISQAFYKV